MRRGLVHQTAMIASFLLVIFAVPMVQSVIEVRQGESPQVLDLFRRVPTAANLRAFERELEDRSWFAQTLRPWTQYARFRLLRDAGSKAIVAREGWWFYRPGVRYLIEPVRNDPKHLTGTGPAVRAIVSLRDQLATRGIHLLIVPVPGKASVYPDKLTARAGHGDPSLRQNTQRLVSDLTARSVEVLDPYDVLVGARLSQTRGAGPQVYMTLDTHWTPLGVRQTSKAVAKRLRERGWIDSGAVTYATRFVTARRQGDIVRMLRTPQIERLYPPDEIPCEQVIDPGTGRPYRDDPNASVLVLGDSFLRIYERDEPGSAGFIAHLARELRQPVASIVNDGGASTLVREELARKPELLAGKRVVVWEFVERDIRFGMEGWRDVRLPNGPIAAATAPAAGASQ